MTASGQAWGGKVSIPPSLIYLAEFSREIPCYKNASVGRNPLGMPNTAVMSERSNLSESTRSIQRSRAPSS